MILIPPTEEAPWYHWSPCVSPIFLQFIVSDRSLY